MAEPFEPYRDWLGVEGGRPAANHYRLLGVKRFETDRATILAAAQAAITRVEKTAASEHAAEQREVLRAIRAAAQCLLNPADRRRYDATLSRPAAIRVAAPLPVATPIDRLDADSRATADTRAVDADVPAAWSPTLWDDEGAIPSTLESARRKSSWQTSLAAALGFLVASMVLAAIGYVAWRQGQPREPPADNGPSPATAGVAVPSSSNAADPAGVSGTLDPPGIAGGPSGPMARRDADEPASRDPIAPSSTPVVVPVEPPPSAADESTTTAEAANESALRFTRALNRVRAALLAREAGLARRRLAETRSWAGAPVQQETLRRLDALAEQLERFLEAARGGLSSFEAAEELNVDGQFVSIVAADAETLSLRVEGARRDYTLATLPAPLALVAARAGVNENAPPAKVFFGAFLLVEPHADPAHVRRLWESAAAAGQPVDDLLPLLDSGELAIEREPAPDAAARAEAERRVAKTFAVTIRGARSKEQQAALVDPLMTAAARADDSADQFALLHQARAQAVLAGDPRRAMAIIDELARWFDVDPPGLKAEMLAQAANASSDAAAARQVAVEALGLLDQVGSESELAGTLASAAVAAARHSGDAQLRKQAATRRQDVDRAARRRGKASAGK